MNQKALIADSCIYKNNLSKHLKITFGTLAYKPAYMACNIATQSSTSKSHSIHVVSNWNRQVERVRESFPKVQTPRTLLITQT